MESSAAESGILPSLTKLLSDVTRKEYLYLLGTSAIGITTIVFTGLILLRRASSQRKHERSGKQSKTRGDSMFGWGEKDKAKKKRNVPDVEIHVPELDIDRLEITLEPSSKKFAPPLSICVNACLAQFGSRAET